MEKTTEHSNIAGIIIITHCNYGAALLNAAESILGPLPNCTAMSVDISADVKETIQNLRETVEHLKQGNGVLILTDMFGGTPTNLALSLLATHNVEVVTGANLPMLLKVFSAREKKLEELAQLAGEAGAKGIVVAGNMLRNKARTKSDS